MLEPIKFFCNSALPAVYDDSLSYYEVLTKLTAKLNDAISSLNSANAQIELLTPKVTKLTNEVGTRPDTITDTLWNYTTQQDTSILAELDRINENVGNIDGRVNSNTNSITTIENEVGTRPVTITEPLWDYTTRQDTLILNDIDQINENVSNIDGRVYTNSDAITTLENDVNELKNSKKGFIDLSGNVVFILPKQSTETWWNTAVIKDKICNILNKNANSVLIEWINPTTSTPANDIHAALLNIQAYESNHTGFSANTTALIIGLGAPTNETQEGDYYYETENIKGCMSQFNNLKNTVILPSYGYNIYSMFSINERMLQIKDQITSQNTIIDNSLGDCLVLGEEGDSEVNAQNNAMVNFVNVLCDYILYGIHHCNYFITDSSFGFLKNVNGEISYFPNGTQIVSGTVNFNTLVNAINSAGINTNVGFGSGKTDGKECIFALAVTNNAVGSTSYTAITPYKNSITLGRKFN